MSINDFLSASHVAIDVVAHDKAGLLKDLAARAAAALDLPAERLADELAKRDELGSTGIGSGVAIPHARLREIRKPFGFLVRLAKPIAFDAIDGQPIDLAFLLMLPAASQLEQLNALAAVARRLREPAVLRDLRSAVTDRDLYRAMIE
jgi:PTS system nitrogen regulatory IIA component